MGPIANWLPEGQKKESQANDPMFVHKSNYINPPSPTRLRTTLFASYILIQAHHKHLSISF